MALPKWLSVVVFLLIALIAVPAVGAAPDWTTWWNTSFLQRYDLNITEPIGYDRIYEPMIINLTTIGCYRQDKGDMRILINNSIIQPYYVRYTNDSAAIVVNLTASQTGRFAYIYCNSTDAQPPGYDLGMTLQMPAGAPTGGVNISLGYNNTIFKMEKRMNMGTLKTDGAFNLSHSNFYEGLGGLYQGAAGDVQGTWSVLDNSPAYIRLKYQTTTPSPAGLNTTIEFFPYNLMARIRTTDTFTYLTGVMIESYIIGNPSPPGTNGIRAASDTLVTYNLNNGWASRTDMGKGIFTDYSSTTYTYVASIFYNESAMAGTPLKKCYSTGDGSDAAYPQGHICGSNCDCSGTNQFNISIAGSESGRWWYGFAPNVESSMNQTYAIKMAPAIYLTGSAELPSTSGALPNITNVNIVPSLAYDDTKLTCNGTPSGGAVVMTVVYEWYNNSAFFTNGTVNIANNTNANISILSQTTTTIGDTWTCRARATADNITFSVWRNATKQINGITRRSSIPSDISFGNLFDNPYNTTYNYWLTQGGNFTIYHKTNNTRNEINYYENGTAVVGYMAANSKVNTSQNVTFSLEEHVIYPGSYNIDFDTHEDNLHTATSLSGTNTFASVEIINISTNTHYNVLEFMANASSPAASALQVYYCNSSYAFSSNPTTSPFCINIGSKLATTAYNHSHSQYSSHSLIICGLNYTTGRVGTVKATPKSYFMFTTGNVAWNLWSVANASRPGVLRVSSNSGNSWTNFTATPDVHVHQIYNDSVYYAYACYNETSAGNDQICSTLRLDALDIANLPPTAPSVYSPIADEYGALIPINWTAAFSETGQSIYRYNVTIRNHFGEVRLTVANNSPTNLNTNICAKQLAGKSWCYQEFANSSLNSTPNCGLVYNGTYFLKNQSPNYIWAPSGGRLTIDGDWTTYEEVQDVGEGQVFINYTKPLGATKYSLWQIKDNSSNLPRNISLESCWQDTAPQVRLWAVSYSSDGGAVSWYCHDGASYINLNYTLLNIGVYEEAMWWDINNTVVPYVASVQAVDNESQSSVGQSSPFTIGYYNHSIANYPAINQTITALVTTIGCQASFAPDVVLNAQLEIWHPGAADNPYLFNFTAVNGIYNYTLPLAGQGQYNWTCRVMDSLCTDGVNATGTQTIFHDSITPTLVLHNPTPGQVIETVEPLNNITFNYTATDAFIDKCWYSSDGGVATVVAGCANFTLTGLSLGTHTIAVYVNDTSNNINSTSITYVLGRMAVDLMSPADGLITNLPEAVGINFSCNVTTYSGNITGMEMWLKYPSSILLALYADSTIISDDTYQINNSFGLSEQGNYTWYCKANNSAGYSILSSNRTILVDRTAPSFRFDAPTNYTTYTADVLTTQSIAVNYTLLSNDAIACNHSYIFNGTAPVLVNGCQNKTIALPGVGGEILYTLNVTDKAGNTYTKTLNFAVGYIRTNLTDGFGVPFALVNNMNFSIKFSGLNFGALSTTANCTAYAYPFPPFPVHSVIDCPVTEISSGGVLQCAPDIQNENATNVTVWCTVGSYLFSPPNVNMWVDTWAPRIAELVAFPSNQSFYNRNLTGSWRFTDSNLFRLNVTIDGVSVYQQSDINLTTKDYSLTYNTSSLPIGRHTLKVEAWDSHTASEIEAYDVANPIFSNKITYDTKRGNIVSIEALESENVVLNPFTTEKQADRYTFAYKPIDTKAESYSFQVDTKAPIYIIDKPDSVYKKWIVSGNNWIDFYTPSLDTDISITKLSANSAMVTVSKRAIASEPVEELPIKELPGDGKQIIKDDDGGKDLGVEPGVAMDVPETALVAFSSIGDLNLATMNYTFYTHNVSMTYTPTVTELAQQQTWLNISHNNSGVFTASVSFVYDGVIYPITGGNSTYKINYLADFTTPNVSSDTTKTGIWFLNFSGETSNYTFTQSIINLAFTSCTAGNENLSLTMCGIDEETLLNVTNLVLNIDFTFWKGSQSVAQDVHFGRSNATCHYFCLTPANTTFNIYSIMEYGDGEVYTDRKYYLYNMSLNTSDPKMVWLYHLNTSLASTILYNVVSKQTGDNVPEAYIRIQRYYPELNQYATVEIEKTDENGRTIEKMVLYNVFYREFVDYPHGMTRLQTEVAKLVATSKVLAIGLGTDIMAGFDTQTNTQVEVGCNPKLGMCNVSWSTLDGSSRTIRLDLYESTGIAKILINSTTNTAPSSSGQLFMYANPYKNNTYYEAKAYIIGSAYPAGTAGMNNQINIFSQDGNESLRLATLIPLILLTISIVCALLDVGVVGVVLGSISGIAVGMVTTLIPVNIPGIISLVILAGILIYKMVK